MHGRLVLCFGFLLAVAGAEEGAREAPDCPGAKRLTLGQLEADLDQLCAAIRTEHPLIHADRAELDRVAARVRSELREGMTDLELLRAASSVVRATHCGHASLSLSEQSQRGFEAEARFLPISLRIVGERLMALRSIGGANVPDGAVIRRIDGRGAQEIVRLLCERMPGDGHNVTRKIFQLNEQFSGWYALLLDAPTEYAVEYVDPVSGEEKTVCVKGVAKTAWPAPGGGKDLPEIGDGEFAGDHAWLRIKSFVFYTPPENRRFRAFVDGFFERLAKHGAKTLVLDLRGNGGGDPYCGAHLLSYLIERPLVYFAESGSYYSELRNELAPAEHAFRGKLIVLIDGGVFSTCGHVVSLLKFHGRGRFVGEETGGSFACTSNSHEIALQHSGLRLSNARTVFRTAVTGLPPGRGVMPDEAVVASVEDLRAGRDPVRERTLALVGGDEGEFREGWGGGGPAR